MVLETNVWKVLLLVGLAVAIVMSLCWRAPRRAVSRSDLHRLVFSGVCLYAVGGFALVVHRHALAGFVFAGGIFTCAVAVWLSRGVDSEDPPDDDDPPADEPSPPPRPDGLSTVDWDDFERAFQAYAARDRAGTA
ncbi:MAG TPA: hypothetical protein VG186_09600 [Solirubrobacteraceae bacterium]|jgi:hypothetical protein|nr:hypothetical protein [Solirubrobacteraceae bacterium]